MNEQAAVKAEEVEEEAAVKALSRDEMRAQLLGKKAAPKSELITVFDTQVEFRQPSFGDLMKVREIESEQVRAVEMIIQYAYVPDTNERVFEDTDRDAILEWPFGQDLVRINDVIARLTGVDIDDAEKELEADPLV